MAWRRRPAEPRRRCKLCNAHVLDDTTGRAAYWCPACGDRRRRRDTLPVEPAPESPDTGPGEDPEG